VNAGAPCNDGNACTAGDVCQADGSCAGGNAVVCAPLDQCHVAGICDPATGQCSNLPADFGTPCDDGDACTTGDHCVLGECTGTPTICQLVDDPAGCWNQPTCDPATGTCTQPTPKPQGAPCDDGNLCTVNDVCDGAGTCAGTPKSCGGIVSGTCPQTCDPTTGECVAGANGDSCIPSNFGQCQTGVCQDGGCVAVPASVGSSCFVVVIPDNPCVTGICSSSGDCVPTPVADGMACSPSTSLGECQTGICQSGACVAANVPDGTLCGDSAAPECSRTSCQAGVCANVSRLGQRCEVELHGCLQYTCQAGGCLSSGAFDACGGVGSCGGQCVQQGPTNGVCVPNTSCAGECFSASVQCCGIGFTNDNQSVVVTCPQGQECCTGVLGAQCCQPGVKCELGGCGTPILDVG
jgi:hypothetical protein